MTAPRLAWFARCDGVARSGPYASQVKAAASLVLADNGRMAPGAFVWPERAPRVVRRRTRRTP